MIRSFSFVFVLATGASLAACNSPTCGPGTKQVQNPTTGDLQCVVVDGTPQPCVDDADAGTVIVGGKCVGAIQCGPNTVLVRQPNGSYDCQGTGMGANVCPSPQPGAGLFCLQGKVVDFKTGAPVANVPVALYDASSVTGGFSASTPTLINGHAVTDPNGLYFMDKVPVPTSGLIAFGNDPAKPTAGYVQAGIGGAVATANQVYKLDAYAVTTAVANGLATGVGTDFTMNGLAVFCYFLDASNAGMNNFSFYETMPSAGTQIGVVGPPTTPQPGVKYLGPTSDKIDATLTATGALGCGVFATSGVATFTGIGPGATVWESTLSGSFPSVVFFGRFHKM